MEEIRKMEEEIKKFEEKIFEVKGKLVKAKIKAIIEYVMKFSDLTEIPREYNFRNGEFFVFQNMIGRAGLREYRAAESFDEEDQEELYDYEYKTYEYEIYMQDDEEISIRIQDKIIIFYSYGGTLISPIQESRLKEFDASKLGIEILDREYYEQERIFEEYIKDTKQIAMGEKRPAIICKDGYSISVQASDAHYCIPREFGLEEYSCFEVAGITQKIIPQIKEWSEDPLDDSIEESDIKNILVYGFVPKAEIVKLIQAHGGMDEEIMQKKVEERKGVYERKDTKKEKIIQEASGGNEFIANILRYAMRNCQLEDQNQRAEQLVEEYEEQLSSPSFDDDEY